MTDITCGVDVSATTLGARIGRDGAYRCIKASSEGIADLVACCQSHQVSLVVMEATGGYERQPAGHLSAADPPTAIVNRRAVRDFVRAMGVLGKPCPAGQSLIYFYFFKNRNG